MLIPTLSSQALEESLAGAGAELRAGAELSRLEQVDGERGRDRRWMDTRSAEADASEEQLIEAMKKMENRKVTVGGAVGQGFWKVSVPLVWFYDSR